MMRMDSIIQAASAFISEEGSPMFVYNRTIRVLELQACAVLGGDSIIRII